MTFKIIYFNFFAICILLSSCMEEGAKKTTHQISPAEIYSKGFQDKLIEANKMYVEKEKKEIDQFIQKNGLEMMSTGTGLRYLISEKGNGEAAALNKQAQINFKVSLLDGTVCYSSDSLGARIFVIGMDNLETGLHEGIQLLHVGDKAKFILPSHLAHGLLGDEIKIPPHSTIVYDVELLAVH